VADIRIAAGANDEPPTGQDESGKIPGKAANAAIDKLDGAPVIEAAE
jgi:hypothetical protein